MSERLVSPNFKVQHECPCAANNCRKTGSRLNARGHVWGCRCPRCTGGRNRRDGLTAQAAARKRLGVPASLGGDANEERWADNVWANEVKSGAQCGPLLNWWRRVEAQVLANRADHGDRTRPVRAVAMPDGWHGDGLVVVRLSAWEELVRPACEEFYGPEAGA